MGSGVPGLLRQTLQALNRRLTVARAPRTGRHHARSETVVLFFNTMFGQPVETEGVPLPDGYRLTVDTREPRRAAAVVFFGGQSARASIDCSRSDKPGD